MRTELCFPNIAFDSGSSVRHNKDESSSSVFVVPMSESLNQSLSPENSGAVYPWTGFAGRSIIVPERRIGVLLPPNETHEEEVIRQLTEETANRIAWEAEQRSRRRRLRTAFILFILTFLSTTLVGANYWPLEILLSSFNAEARTEILADLNWYWPSDGEVLTLWDHFWMSVQRGCLYSVPLMLILFCHEMGHFLQAVRHRVPASLPYFIPLPLPPLGTMGAVIMQKRGVADRKMMFDIAVSGPIAGLLVTIPVLIYGISTSEYIPVAYGAGFEFGQPLVVRWIIEAFHGAAPAGMIFGWNEFATAGWVGVFITALNLLPIGQLDGGHLMYTLVGRAAHWIAWALILIAAATMIYFGIYSYVLLLILITWMGPRHPPTADDRMALGWGRHVLGWATLAFLLIGFTFQPIILPDESDLMPQPEPFDIVETAESGDGQRG